MKRILVVTQYFAEHAGGLQIVAREVAQRLQQRGFEVVWAASRIDFRSDTSGVRRLPMAAWNITERCWGVPYPLWGPCSLWRLWQEVRRCDLVHLHDTLYLGNVAAYLCAKLAHKPVLVTQHIDVVPYSNGLLRWVMEVANRVVARPLLRDSSACVFYSYKVGEYFERLVCFQRRPSWIANGIATKLFHPVPAGDRRRLHDALGWPADAFVVLFVGRFVEKKGLGLMRQLAERFPACRWVLIGYGPASPRSWGLTNVEHHSPLTHPEIAAYYQAADLVLLPSCGEGLPLVVQEAMCCGTPVLVSTETARCLPGLERAAFVSDLALEDLAAALQRILASRDQASEWRGRSVAFAREQWDDWEDCADRYQRLIEEVLESQESLSTAGRTRGQEAAPALPTPCRYASRPGPLAAQTVRPL